MVVGMVGYLLLVGRLSIGRLVNWLVDWLVDLPADWCIVAFGEGDCWPLGSSMTSCCLVSIDCWLVDWSQGWMRTRGTKKTRAREDKEDKDAGGRMREEDNAGQ